MIGVALLLGVFALVQKRAVDSGADKAPPIVGTTLDGQSFDLSSRKGKLTMVNFWATWCGPCRMEFPDLIELQKKYGDRGFTVVGIVQEGPEATAEAKQVAKDSGLNYPNLMITPEIASGYSQVNNLPTSFLIDGNGKVVFQYVGVDPGDPPLKKFGREIESRL
jgi:cytochrome c biogenesis protein CcmG/thiol:disulfide interchange protein DsbE